MSGKIGGSASLAYVPMLLSQPLDQLIKLLGNVGVLEWCGVIPQFKYMEKICY
tara:strand:+ start:952 stop:1110 length:159 start_codon:yes stop_codon:yes gene_type:complete